jgi:hypothetical protein
MRFTVDADFDDLGTLRRLTVLGIDVTEQHTRAEAATPASAPELPGTSS